MLSRTEERPARVAPGLVMLLLVIVIGLLAVAVIVASIASAADTGAPTTWTWVGLIGGLLLGGLAALMALGLFVVQPNQGAVLILFGRYIGTVRRDGWF